MSVMIGGNPLLKYGGIALVVGIASVALLSHREPPSESAGTSTAKKDEQPVVVIEKKETRLGGEADTPETTVETLAGTVRQLTADMTELKNSFPGVNNDGNDKEARTDSPAMRKVKELEGRLELLTESLEGGRDQPQRPQSQPQPQELPEPQEQQQPAQANNQTGMEQALTDYPEGKSFGLGNDELPQGNSGAFTLPDVPNLMTPGKQKNTAKSQGNIVDDDDVEWIQPSDAQKVIDPKTKKEVVTLPKFKGSPYTRPAESANDLAIAGVSNDKDKKSSLVPVYTIEVGAAMLGAVAETALIGRIPVDNQVTSPYPFQVVVGAKNLASNGIRIPNLKGMILNGTATGDYTLRCVRGEIDSVTYTFTDGTIRTVTSSGGGDNSGGKGSLGYLADAQGVSCVSGKYISNLPEYLAQLTAINTAAGMAEAFAEGQQSLTTNTDGSTTSVIAGGAANMNYMLGKGIGSGVKSGADALAQRQQGAYAAIYVKPGARVEVRITQQIEIDYDKKGRKVSHVQQASLYSRNRGLD